MPEYILGELCERVPGLAVGDDRVRLSGPVPPDDVLETTELTLVRLLREQRRRDGAARARARSAWRPA